MFDPGSWRDPRGRVFWHEGRVFRSVTAHGIDDFNAVRNSGLLDELTRHGQIVGTTIIENPPQIDEAIDARLVLEHERVPFISYPYEWSFNALKAAALLHLDVQLRALKHDIALSDASSYNVQFIGSRAVFIDVLSLRPYRDGEFWLAHRQFCEQFLNPLLLRAYTGVHHNAWVRGALEGISTQELAALLPWRARLSWNTLTQVILQARLQGAQSSRSRAVASKNQRRLPKIAFQGMLEGMRRWIAKLAPPARQRSVWQDYATNHSYAGHEADDKAAFVAEFTRAVEPKLLIDVGCNTGDYSRVALDAGAGAVIGFDADHGALEMAWQRSEDDAMNFLPLYMDAANPTPNQGWAQCERSGLAERAKADAVIALALIHHLAIARNVPLNQVIDRLVDMAPQGIIEFVPKTDPMVVKLLELREDIFDSYTAEVFETSLGARCDTVKSVQVSAAGRRLYWFKRR